MILQFTPGAEALSEQQSAGRILGALFRNRAIPHALLFTGIEGVGKKAAAIRFAMACNCRTQPDGGDNPRPISDLWSVPCGNCRSCQKIASKNHPDIIVIEPAGIWIKISQIRDLHHILALKPYEARLRVVIIADAQAMNPEAGNALLKMLEEPPDRTVLVLTAVEKGDLLPTIVSRCRHIRFHPIPPARITEILQRNHGLNEDEAAIAAAIANGSLSKALAAAQPAEGKRRWIEYRNHLISGSGLDRVGSDPEKPFIQLMAFAEKLSENKKNLPDILELLKSFARDLLIFRYHPDRIINKDLTERIQYASQSKPVPSLMAQIETIQRAQRDIVANVNPRLALEAMIAKISKVNNEKSSWDPF
ncbi:MAG: DNA polymerase III subunit delta' [Pseudomonadota bacterium]